MTKAALIINTESEIGLSVIRKIANLGYHVYSLVLDDNSYSTENLQFQNPELKELLNIIKVDPSIIESPLKVYEQHLEDLSFDLVISLNPTEKTVVKWDLELIKYLTSINYIGLNTTVILARNSYEQLSTYNKSLENICESIDKTLNKNNILCINLIQLGCLEGDESFIAETISTEVSRLNFKTDKPLQSVEDYLSYLIFYYLPGFLLFLAIFLQEYYHKKVTKVKSE